MATRYTKTQAVRVFNATELTLFEDSRMPRLRSFTAKQLEARVQRARQARDRARDLVQRQALASRARTGSKSGQSGDANARSKLKGDLLADILERFEQQLAKARDTDTAGADTKSATASKKAAAKRDAPRAPARQGGPAPQAGGDTRGKRTADIKALDKHGRGDLHEGFDSARARNAAQERQYDAANNAAIQGHISSRDRRKQGRRDSRG